MMWIPNTMVQRSPRIYVATFIDYEPVFDDKPSLGEIISAVKRFRRADCLLLLSKICAILSNEKERSRDVQHYLTKAFFSKQKYSKLWSQAEKERAGIAFSNRSVLGVLQLAAVYCDPEGPPLEMKREHVEQIAKACLAMNHLYLPVLRAPPSGVKPECDKKLVYKLIVQDLWFRRFERFTHALPRYWELLCRGSGPEGVNFGDLFREATGASFEEHSAVTVALWANWQSVSISSIEQDPGSLSPLVDPDVYFRECFVGRDVVDRVLSNYVQDVSALADKLRRHFHEGFDPFALFLAQRPLLRLHDGKVICSSPRLLYERMTCGQYWQILDGVADSSLRKRFLDELGYRFEDYVFRLLQRLAGHNRCHKIAWNGELADAVVEYPDVVLFVQAKTGHPREEVIRQGDLRGLMCELRKKSVLLAAKQIAGGVRAFLSGRCSIAGRTPRDFVCIYPLVVLLRPLQFDPLTWSVLDRQKEIKGLTEFATLKPLQVICCEELEMMQSVCEMRGLDLPALLEEKIAWDAAGRCCMKNFLIEKFGSIPRNAYLRGIADGIFKDVVGPLLWPPLD